MNEKSKISHIDEKISVIVPLRNEEKNIKQLCESLQNQSYNNEWEIIFVDDDSNDSTIFKLQKYKTSNSKIIKVKDVNEQIARKKYAIEQGIKISSGEILVVTDADCTHPKKWLETIVEEFDSQTGVVAGPVDLITDNSIFGAFQKLEYAGLILTGAGLIGSNNPTICSASNLAYRKSVFNCVNGFEGQKQFTSGDDDLFIQKVAKFTDRKVSFCFNKNALVKTDGKNNFNDFMNQRKRWASKSIFYDNKFLVLKIISIFLFYFGIIVQPILGFIISGLFFVSFAISLLFKILFEFRILSFGAKYLYENDMNKIILIAELIQIPYIIYSGILGLFGNFEWKDRKVKR